MGGIKVHIHQADLHRLCLPQAGQGLARGPLDVGQAARGGPAGLGGGGVLGPEPGGQVQHGVPDGQLAGLVVDRIAVGPHMEAEGAGPQGLAGALLGLPPAGEGQPSQQRKAEGQHPAPGHWMSR